MAWQLPTVGRSLCRREISPCHLQAKVEVVLANARLASAMARRRQESCTAEVKKWAKAKVAEGLDHAAAAVATEEHFAGQHRKVTVKAKIVKRWVRAGVEKYKANTRGGLRGMVCVGHYEPLVE